MRKIILNVPDRLFDHLSTVPTLDDEFKNELMVLPPALRAEVEVLYKLNELYCNYDEEDDDEGGRRKMESMANACETRINEIERMGRKALAADRKRSKA